MSWTVGRIQHNANILYNHIGRDPVYVDERGDLQVGKVSKSSKVFNKVVSWASKQKISKDTSHKKISEVSIRTLREVLNAVEEGALNSKKIIKNKRNEWIDREKFGVDISNILTPYLSYSNFNSSWGSYLKHRSNKKLSSQLIHRVLILGQMLIHGKEHYKNFVRQGEGVFGKTENFYDGLSEEEKRTVKNQAKIASQCICGNYDIPEITEIMANYL